MCESTHSLDHQTSVEWKIKHAPYIEQVRQTLKHNLLGQRDRQNNSTSAAWQVQRGERGGGQHCYHRSMCSWWRWVAAVSASPNRHQDLTAAIPDWQDPNMAEKNIKCMLSCMTNCLLKQCTQCIKWPLNNQWSFGHRLDSHRGVHSESVHATMSGGGWFRSLITQRCSLVSFVTALHQRFTILPNKLCVEEICKSA